VPQEKLIEAEADADAEDFQQPEQMHGAILAAKPPGTETGRQNKRETMGEERELSLVANFTSATLGVSAVQFLLGLS
jgi:hypothetical protein